MRRSAFGPAALLVAILLHADQGALRAQGSGLTDRERRAAVGELQLEHSSISSPLDWGHPDRLWFEGKIVPHLYLESPEATWGFVLTPKVVLRMHREPSAPVRSPSFMPQFQAQWVRSADAVVQVVSARIGHHSNGQEGDFLDEDGEPNYPTGSFSTNYIRVGYARHNARLYSPSSLGQAGVWLEVHPSINQSEELEDDYGRLRLGFESQALAVGQTGSSFAQVFFRGTYLGWMKSDIPNLWSKRRWIFESDVLWGLSSMRDFTVWINLYRGPDYYNIQYRRVLTMLRVGIQTSFVGRARSLRR